MVVITQIIEYHKRIANTLESIIIASKVQEDWMIEANEYAVLIHVKELVRASRSFQ